MSKQSVKNERLTLLRHNMRTPLTQLKGNAYVIERSIRDLPDGVKTPILLHLEQIKQHIDQILHSHELVVGNDPATQLAKAFAAQMSELKRNLKGRAFRNAASRLTSEFRRKSSEAKRDQTPITQSELEALQLAMFRSAHAILDQLDPLRQALKDRHLTTQQFFELVDSMQSAAEGIRSIVLASRPGGHQTFDVRTLLSNLPNAPLRKTHQFELEIEHPEEPVLLHGERHFLNEALLTVLQNSIDHNNPQRSLRILVTLEHTPNEVILRVRDTGKGIPRRRVKTLFTAFRSDRPLRQRLLDAEHGKGLRVVHDAISTVHKGSISVKSRVGKRTTFTFRIPKNLPNC